MKYGLNYVNLLIIDKTQLNFLKWINKNFNRLVYFLSFTVTPDLKKLKSNLFMRNNLNYLKV